jgi:hypothetical protein
MQSSCSIGCFRTTHGHAPFDIQVTLVSRALSSCLLTLRIQSPVIHDPLHTLETLSNITFNRLGPIMVVASSSTLPKISNGKKRKISPLPPAGANLLLNVVNHPTCDNMTKILSVLIPQTALIYASALKDQPINSERASSPTLLTRLRHVQEQTLLKCFPTSVIRISHLPDKDFFPQIPRGITKNGR